MWSLVARRLCSSQDKISRALGHVQDTRRLTCLARSQHTRWTNQPSPWALYSTTYIHAATFLSRYPTLLLSREHQPAAEDCRRCVVCEVCETRGLAVDTRNELLPGNASASSWRWNTILPRSAGHQHPLAKHRRTRGTQALVPTSGPRLCVLTHRSEAHPLASQAALLVVMRVILRRTLRGCGLVCRLRSLLLDHHALHQRPHVLLHRFGRWTRQLLGRWRLGRRGY